MRSISQYRDHCRAPGWYRRSASPANPLAGNVISSTLAAPPKRRAASETPGNFSYSLESSRKSVRQRLATSQVPARKSKSLIEAG